MAAHSGLHVVKRVACQVQRNPRLQANFLDGLFLQRRCFRLAAQLLKPRKRYEWRKDRKPANTKLIPNGEEVLETRRTYGGRSKVKAVSKNKGTYTLKSQGIELEVPILDVVHSESNKNHVTEKILVKGTIVQLDGSEFKNRLGEADAQNVSNCENNRSETADTSVTADGSIPDTEQSQKSKEIDNTLLEILESGKLYGKITTKPGQNGLCDGYVLEGAELQEMMKKLSLMQPS